MERYEPEYGVEVLKMESGKRRLSTRYYPSIPIKNSDKFIVSKRGMRWDNLAYQFYRDQSLWFMIARANNIVNGSLVVPPGIRIRIPDLTNEEIETYFED